MKQLHFLRHAKAPGRELHESDFERPLARRGIAACKIIAAHLAETAFAVEHVYCSPARRTKETYALIKESLGDAQVSFRDKLYFIDGGGLLNFIGEESDKIASVMIIGHNPGLHMIARRLTQCAADGHAPDLAAMTRKFPTGALCSLRFEVQRWCDVVRSSGTLMAFVRPRDLD